MVQKFANAARGLLASNIAAGDTTITITEGGGLFPVANGTDWFKAVLQDADGIEIVQVNTHTSASNSFTAVRGQEGTTARAFAAGSVFGQRVTAEDMEAAVFGDVSTTATQNLTNKTIIGAREARVAMGANNIDLLAGNFFTKTISGATTFTVSNVPADGTAASFILDLTNGGSGAITWWSGMKWAGGTAPTLTASGRDCLGFFTHDGGTTWTGLLLGKDVK